ncbi:hypothetical protein DL98DRAFT_7039 [Cadophora sp. DSE1049]|nr:hypothetical protein DL98DRAFT_7039 [Cadophora sp. DSE1049]
MHDLGNLGSFLASLYDSNLDGCPPISLPILIRAVASKLLRFTEAILPLETCPSHSSNDTTSREHTTPSRTTIRNQIAKRSCPKLCTPSTFATNPRRIEAPATLSESLSSPSPFLLADSSCTINQAKMLSLVGLFHRS